MRSVGSSRQLCWPRSSNWNANRVIREAGSGDTTRLHKPDCINQHKINHTKAGPESIALQTSIERERERESSEGSLLCRI